MSIICLDIGTRIACVYISMSVRLLRVYMSRCWYAYCVCMHQNGRTDFGPALDALYLWSVYGGSDDEST